MKNSELMQHAIRWSDRSLDLPPSAVMGISEDDPNILRVCGHCETNKQAIAWGKARDYRVSHGICSACMTKHFPDLVIPRVMETVAGLSDATLAECAAVKARAAIRREAARIVYSDDPRDPVVGCGGSLVGDQG